MTCCYGVLVAMALFVGAVCEGVKAAHTYISTKTVEKFGEESGDVVLTFLFLVVVPTLLAVKWGWYCVASYYGVWIALALVVGLIGLIISAVCAGAKAAYTWIET